MASRFMTEAAKFRGEIENSLVMRNFMADGDQNLYGVYENYQTNTFHICRYYYDAELSTKQRKHCRYTDFMRVGWQRRQSGHLRKNIRK